MHKEFYAEYYQIEDRHWWFVGRRHIFLKLLDKCLSTPTEGRQRCILDLGCGAGTMLGRLSRCGETQDAEADEAAVQFCRERETTTVQQVDSLPLPFQDATFDLITAFDVREHIDDELKPDFTLTQPGRTNKVLARLFAIEASLVERTSLPYGVPILALASKLETVLSGAAETHTASASLKP